MQHDASFVLLNFWGTKIYIYIFFSLNITYVLCTQISLALKKKKKIYMLISENMKNKNSVACEYISMSTVSKQSLFITLIRLNRNQWA